MSKTIGILGSGIVARTLGSGYLDAGYEVMLGSRDPEKLKDWIDATGGRGRSGTFAEAAAAGDILILAVKGSAAEAALKLADHTNLAGKTVMDATNPIADSPPEDGVLSFFTGPGESLMERLQKLYPGARFVKAFNSVGSARMVKPDYDGQKPTMFLCGDDERARREAAFYIGELGWEILDLGTSRAAGLVESLCALWCIPGFRDGSWTHAFKVLRN